MAAAREESFVRHSYCLILLVDCELVSGVPASVGENAVLIVEWWAQPGIGGEFAHVGPEAEGPAFPEHVFVEFGGKGMDVNVPATARVAFVVHRLKSSHEREVCGFGFGFGLYLFPRVILVCWINGSGLGVVLVDPSLGFEIRAVFGIGIGSRIEGNGRVELRRISDDRNNTAAAAERREMEIQQTEPKESR
ncbi:serine carboxypeptidase S28 family protein [Striga asiatica]|uniref:Serine carboxypeptidase S28 family protein n=1 Tax=Striga asiatica TaxID=4170 RepID=A0A5A7PA38_STRAF|nr:serine carboxypeptidase S28 family protein [Striga asiatica]